MVGTASATTWSVDGSGGADFIRIQDAINDASAGDTIIVHSCVYYENVVVDKSVTLKGIGQPVVDGCGKGNVIVLCADGITLEGFTVTNSGSSREGVDAGVKVTSNNNNLIGNNASNNNEDGIILTNSNNNIITGNNANSNKWVGICLSSSSNNNITGNNIGNNRGYGIYLSDSCNNNIKGNKFVKDGLFVEFPYQNTMENNTEPLEPPTKSF